MLKFRAAEELYHQSCDSVAVIFASITNYSGMILKSNNFRRITFSGNPYFRGILFSLNLFSKNPFFGESFLEKNCYRNPFYDTKIFKRILPGVGNQRRGNGMFAFIE